MSNKKRQKKPRKSRADSVSESMRAAQHAKNIIMPKSGKLCKEGQRYFQEILTEKAVADWTPHEVSIVEIIAYNMALYHKQKMDKKDQSLLNTIISLRRSIGIHFAKDGDARDIRRRNQIAKDVQDGVANTLDDDKDDLLAKPTQH